jgi:hypothetical protein
MSSALGNRSIGNNDEDEMLNFGERVWDDDVVFNLYFLSIRLSGIPQRESKCFKHTILILFQTAQQDEN